MQKKKDSKFFLSLELLPNLNKIPIILYMYTYPQGIYYSYGAHLQAVIILSMIIITFTELVSHTIVIEERKKNHVCWNGIIFQSDVHHASLINPKGICVSPKARGVRL